jgi:hypothetical protein
MGTKANKKRGTQPLFLLSCYLKIYCFLTASLAMPTAALAASDSAVVASCASIAADCMSPTAALLASAGMAGMLCIVSVDGAGGISSSFWHAAKPSSINIAMPVKRIDISFSPKYWFAFLQFA